jgi:transcriptional regulator with GAF, ATPase, and Fis domain
MKIDENKFFIETTLRICGTLEIEKALHEAFMYIRGFIPSDKAYLTYYEPDLRTIRVVASATSEGGEIPDIKVKIPHTPEHLYKKASPPEVHRVGCPASHPIVKHALDFVGENSSLLVMRLILDDHFLGAFSLEVEGKDRFTEEQARLMGLLNDPFAIALSNGIRHRKLLKYSDRLVDDKHYLQDELRNKIGDEIIGANFGLKGVMELVNLVAPINSPVLLFGETGTGKELVANAIHGLSARADGPFITVNCGSIPETLMDSELFGHEKGAFTGAIARKRGRFERAHGGTIFLDEVGELPPEAQVRLLRVLQEKEIERVGGIESVKVDIRVIAATHRDLEKMVKEERFRDDLYFRLKVFPIQIPSLRQRRSDIPALVHHFMQIKNREMCLKGYPTLAPGAIEQLMAYEFPGNVRELEHLVERELILSRGNPLTFGDIQGSPNITAAQPVTTANEQTMNLDSMMSIHIEQVLNMTGGRVEGKQGADELLGVKANTLRYRMKKLGISYSRGFSKKKGKYVGPS